MQPVGNVPAITASSSAGTVKAVPEIPVKELSMPITPAC